MAFNRLTTNTTTTGTGYFVVGGQGASLASASTITVTDSVHEVTGSTTINTISGGVAGMGLFLIRPAGATWALGSSGNIDATPTATDDRYTLLVTPDGSNWYGPSGFDSAIISFTPYGHIAATTLQGAIQELVDEKTNTPNLTEDTTPDTAADFLTTWDTSASAYKKVKPQNLGALLKTGGTLTGVVLFPNGTAAAPSLALSGDSDTGIFGDSSNSRLIFSSNGTARAQIGTTSLRLNSSHNVGWSTTADPTATADLTLARGAARRLDIAAEGTNPAAVRIQGNGTTATRYLALSNDGTDGIISVPLGDLNVDAATNLNLKIGGTTQWAMTSSALAPATTNVETLGTSSAFIKDAYVSTSVQGTRTKDLVEGNATAFVQIAVASGSEVSGHVEYRVYANQNSSNLQVRSGMLFFRCVNVAGTETVVLTTVGDDVAVSGGTLTNSFDVDTSPTNAFNIRANATSSLAQTTLNISYRVSISSGTATVTPQ